MMDGRKWLAAEGTAYSCADSTMLCYCKRYLAGKEYFFKIASKLDCFYVTPSSFPEKAVNAGVSIFSICAK